MEQKKAPSEQEYKEIKRSLLRDIFRAVEKNPNAIELDHKSNEVLLKDVFDENSEVRPRYRSWLDSKIFSFFSAREMLNDR